MCWQNPERQGDRFASIVFWSGLLAERILLHVLLHSKCQVTRTRLYSLMTVLRFAQHSLQQPTNQSLCIKATVWPHKSDLAHYSLAGPSGTAAATPYSRQTLTRATMGELFSLTGPAMLGPQAGRNNVRLKA